MATATLVSILVALVPQQVTATGARRGYAAHYRVGLMERVARNRGMAWRPCMVASSYYSLGTVLSVKSLTTGAWATCTVVDVTAPRDIALVRKRGIVIEFGAANILRMCNLRYVGQEPPSACKVAVYASRSN